jgi:hypothetical protein
MLAFNRSLLNRAYILMNILKVLAPTVLPITYRHGSHRKHRSSFGVSNCCCADTLIAKPLLSNGCCILDYLAVVAEQRLYMPQ